MDDQRYRRELEAALQLLAFLRECPDAPEHVVVSNFVFTILAAISCEIDRDGGQ